MDPIIPIFHPSTIPISPGPLEGETCETNPIRPTRQAGRVPGEGECAKRTQFGPGVPAPAGPNVRNEPNSRRRRVGRGVGDTGREGCRAKQSQFGPQTRMDESQQGGRHSRLWDQSCQTNPIHRRRQEGQVPCGKRVMTNWTRKMASAKQSQLRDGQARARAGKAGSSAGRAGCTNKANLPRTAYSWWTTTGACGLCRWAAPKEPRGGEKGEMFGGNSPTRPSWVCLKTKTTGR